MATLLLVHAHPDDEVISTGGIMLRAHRDGHRVVLVTATRGEEGEIFVYDPVTTRPRLGEVRVEELRRAGEVLGVDRQELLGFRDSGMAGEPSNDAPDSFHSAPLAVAAERLAVVLREERPALVVTYTADGTYGHPDHIRAHETTEAALDLLRDEGWEPAHCYQHAIPASVAALARERFRDQPGADDPSRQLRGTPDEQITARVDVRDLVGEKRRALACHVSQIDPHGPWGTANTTHPTETMADQIFETALGWEHFVRTRGTGGPKGTVRTLLT